VVWDHNQLITESPGSPWMEFDSPAFRQAQLDGGHPMRANAKISAFASRYRAALVATVESLNYVRDVLL
jgi:hypothetical protein